MASLQDEHCERSDLHLVAGLQVPFQVLHLFSQSLMLTLQIPHLCTTTKSLWPFVLLRTVLAADEPKVKHHSMGSSIDNFKLLVC